MSMVLGILHVLGGILAVAFLCILVICALLFLASILYSLRVHPQSKRHGTLCPRCGTYMVYGAPGERVCTACGAHERVTGQ